jgi:hypothetical protein
MTANRIARSKSVRKAVTAKIRRNKIVALLEKINRRPKLFPGSPEEEKNRILSRLSKVYTTPDKPVKGTPYASMKKLIKKMAFRHVIHKKKFHDGPAELISEPTMIEIKNEENPKLQDIYMGNPFLMYLPGVRGTKLCGSDAIDKYFSEATACKLKLFRKHQKQLTSGFVAEAFYPKRGEFYFLKTSLIKSKGVKNYKNHESFLKNARPWLQPLAANIQKFCKAVSPLAFSYQEKYIENRARHPKYRNFRAGNTFISVIFIHIQSPLRYFLLPHKRKRRQRLAHSRGQEQPQDLAGRSVR